MNKTDVICRIAKISVQKSSLFYNLNHYTKQTITKKKKKTTSKTH